MKEIKLWFEKNKPELLNQLSLTYHKHSNGNDNPFHLENDVLTHTLMVYDNIKSEQIELYIAAILHDIGKIYTRNEKNSGKVSFFGHENVSTIYAIDILNELVAETMEDKKIHRNFLPNISEKDFQSIDKILVLQLIAWHGLLWRKKSVDHNQRNNLINSKFSHDGFYQKFVEFVKADAFGRITNDEDDTLRIMEDFEYLENYIPFNKNLYSQHNPQNEVIMLVGLSGSGKSTLINKLIIDNPQKDYKIISIDNYLSKGKLDYNSVNYKKEVKKAHTQSLKDIKNYISNNDNVIIDMTNLSIETRRKKLSLFPSTKYKKIGIVLLIGLTQLEINLKLREKTNFNGKERKTISKDIINKQIKSFELPGLDEFDELEYII
jgi:predicted kinase